MVSVMVHTGFEDHTGAEEHTGPVVLENDGAGRLADWLTGLVDKLEPTEAERHDRAEGL